MSYWNNCGKHQALYDCLLKELVPKSGRAATPDGKLLRCFSALYTEGHCNGFGNVSHAYVDEVNVLLGSRERIETMVPRAELTAVAGVFEDLLWFACDVEEDEDEEEEEEEAGAYESDAKERMEYCLAHIDLVADAVVLAVAAAHPDLAVPSKCQAPV